MLHGYCIFDTTEIYIQHSSNARSRKVNKNCHQEISSQHETDSYLEKSPFVVWEVDCSEHYMHQLSEQQDEQKIL